MKVRVLEKTTFMVHHDGLCGPSGRGVVETFDSIDSEPVKRGVFLEFDTPNGKRSIHQDCIRSITTGYIYKEDSDDSI